MIITVTMNPAIDKSIDIGKFEHGGLNRIRHMEMDAGGKGINVSKTIQALGGKSLATGFLAGNTGDMIARVLKQNDIDHDFIYVSGETRTNTKVVEEGGIVTELNEPGPDITPAQLQQLVDKLENLADEDTLLVLAGSVPAKVEKTIYRDIIERVHKKGAKVLLDADGELFVHALEAGPDLIKPNRVELEELFHTEVNVSEEELVKMGRKLLDKGIELIAISMGGQGALFLTRDKIFKGEGLSVKAHSTVGAGDAMVAALSYGTDMGMSVDEIAKLAMAVSAGAVTTIGTKPPTRELVDELEKQVVLKEFY